jgi:hypothetical protein
VRPYIPVLLSLFSLVIGGFAGYLVGSWIEPASNAGQGEYDSVYKDNPELFVETFLKPGSLVGDFRLIMATRYISSRCIRLILKGNYTSIVDVCSKEIPKEDAIELEKYLPIPPTYKGKFYDYSSSTLNEENTLSKNLNVLAQLDLAISSKME